LAEFFEGRIDGRFDRHIAVCQSCVKFLEQLECQAQAPISVCASETVQQGFEEYFLRCGLVESAETVTQERPGAPRPGFQANLLETSQAERYVDRKLIGRGSFADVYSAWDARLQIQVALKVLRPELFASEQRLNDFMQEARCAAKLDHPGLVPVRDVYLDFGRPAIVLKLVDGESLESRLKRGSLYAVKSVQMMTQIARAVHHAHEANLIHCDLKPANILLDKNESPAVGDFGVAVDLQELSESLRSRDLGGTYRYMSPEHHAHMNRKGTLPPLAPLDRRSDVWALGVMLAEMLQGRCPFPQTDKAELFSAVSTSQPELDPNLDRGLAAMIQRCLEKKSVDRFASADELANGLVQWQQRRDNFKQKARWAILSLVVLMAFLLIAPTQYQRWKTQQTLGELITAPAPEVANLISELVKRQVKPESLKIDSDSPSLNSQLRLGIARVACGGGEPETWSELVDVLQQLSSENEFEKEFEGELAGVISSLRPRRESPACRGFVAAAVDRLRTLPADKTLLANKKSLGLAAIIAELGDDFEVCTERNEKVVQDLLAVLAIDEPKYLANFRSIGVNHLLPELRRQAQLPESDKQQTQSGRQRAAHAIRVFLMEQVADNVADNERQRVSNLETLAQVVMNVDWDLVGKLVEFDSSLSRNKTNGTLEYPEYTVQQRATLVGILQQRFDELATIPRATDPKDLDDQAPPTETDLQMARLAVALWQLGNTTAANSALRDEPDPTLKTQFIFGLARQQLNLPWLVEELEQRFQQGNNESPALFGLLQVLWLIPNEHLASTVNREWLDTLWLTSTDNGVHAMAGLLLRKLGVTPTPLNPGSYGNWRVEKVGPLQIELAVISKQAFTGGISPESTRYSGNEALPLYRWVIERDYAIGLQEVTYQQYREFERDFEANMRGEIAIYNLGDQQVFAFCNWCSRQQGLDCCYEMDEALRQLIPRVDYQKLNGYRLPTEDEWECACRAGTITGRFFGQNSTSPPINEKLVPQFFQYGWLRGHPRLEEANKWSLPVCQLLPNRWGLFDIYGNVRELWAQRQTKCAG
jgi:serine/threonine protein kinase